MGWFRRTNLTDTWVKAPGVSLELNLDRFTLNGIGPGEPVEGLSFLGPGRPGLLKREIQFPDSGVVLDIESTILMAIHIHIQPSEDDHKNGMQPFLGTVTFREKPLSLGAQMGVANLIAEVGKPDYFEDNGDERILTYHPNGIEWELLLTPENRVRMISIYVRKNGD